MLTLYGRFYYNFFLHVKNIIPYYCPPILLTYEKGKPRIFKIKNSNLNLKITTVLYQKIGTMLNNIDCWILDAQLDA